MTLTRLTLAALVAAAFVPPVQAAPPVAYEAVHQGVVTRVDLQIDGPRFQGRLTEEALQLALNGAVQGRTLSGQVQDPRSGQALMPMAAELRGDELVLELRPPAATAQRLSLRRVGAAAAAGAPAAPAAAMSGGALDAQLVGRWRQESQINSPGGAGGFASFSTVRTLVLGADGRAQQTVRSVGGGGDWSADGGERIEFSGRWTSRDGSLFVQPDGQPRFIPAGRYRFSGQYLVTENGQGRLIWSR